MSSVPPKSSSIKKKSYPKLSSSSSRPVRAAPIRSIQERRINEFVGGQFSDYNLASLLFENRSDSADHVQIERWSPPPGTKPPFKEAVKQEFRPAKKGERFGPSWSNHWLKLHLKVPEEWRDKDWVQLEFDPGCEAMIFSQDGMPLQGITGGYDDNRRVDFPLPQSFRKGVTLYAEITANGMFGLPSDASGDPDPNRQFTLASADIVVKRPEAWKLMWDFQTLSQCIREMPKDGVLQNKALWVANEIMNTFRKADLDSISKCRKLAEEVLGTDWEKQGAKLYEQDVVEGREDTLIWSLGHTHIDSAWLWPYSATQQKVARSWSTQLDLMDRYPEFRFTASTAQQFQWLEQLYPELFKRVQDKVKEAKFQPIGGSWVECDANMPSGEAFVRQFVYGQRFFQTRFGKRCNIFWLPDTFGYNAQIPQLARQAGCDYFFTQKLSWNNINRFPHNTVMWVGLDGTQIMVHLTPVNNYDSQCGVDDLVRGVKNNQNLQVQPAALHLFGFGDGGGGPTEVMLERLRRARAISNNGYKEMPRVTVGRSADDFFEHVRKITEDGKRLATWAGEIYLEFHRGVYTSHGSIKQWNRQFEVIMHDLEWISTLASLRSGDYEYPKKEIDDLWEPLLLNQFHDCLPGSAIRKVYDDLEEIYADMLGRAKVLFQKARKALSEACSSPIKGRERKALGAINTLGIPRLELVRADLDSPFVKESILAAATDVVQRCEEKSGSGLLLVEDVDGSGHGNVVQDSARIMRNLEAVSVEETDHNEFALRSSAISVKVAKGRISSIYDHATGRELLAKGLTAGLSIAEDYPPQFDNWETEIYSLDTVEEIAFDTVRISEEGPWRCSLALEAKFGKSKVKVKMSLDALPASTRVGRQEARPLIRLETEIDWWEKHRFLRFEVPTRLRSGEASYETQFGITRRPTTRNTSWEAAKFEVCGHRFADLSEPNQGLSILTQTKYGYSVEGGRMRLSLLKAGTYPDAHEDEGKHRFTFALYPHLGDLAQADVVNVARRFNSPLKLDAHLVGLESRSLSMPISILPRQRGVEGGGILLDTVKRAEQDFEYHGTKPTTEKGDKSIVCRLYESIGVHSKATLKM
ncbi:putative AMS1-alpha-mannosidase, partial [Violaceomyces palustris]